MLVVKWLRLQNAMQVRALLNATYLSLHMKKGKKLEFIYFGSRQMLSLCNAEEIDVQGTKISIGLR